MKKRFKSQRGAVVLGTILLTFTICGLITTGVGVYSHVEQKRELKKVVKMIRENAHNLKKNHSDDPHAFAQAEAWERMAASIDTHEDIVYNKKMLKEAANLGINLIPGKLPFKKGTREAIEFWKNIYDTQNGLKDSWGNEPKEPSKEMKDFLKAISKGRVSADALEIVMLRVREQALDRKLEKLKADIKADKEWKEGQQELLTKYRQMFIENTLKNLRETGKLSSYYKRRWKRDGLPEDLAQYPEIVEVFNKPDKPDKPDEELLPITEEEKEEINNLVHEVVSQNEQLKDVLKESLDDDQGDDEKVVGQLVEILQEVAESELEGGGQEEEDEKEEGGLLDSIVGLWRGGTHNTFNFESVGTQLKYEAVRHDGWSIGTDYIDNVVSGSFISYTGSLFNQHNTAIVVYISADGNLYYKVIDPYAVSGKDRSYMGIAHSGILGENVGSIEMSKLRFTRKGKYGVKVSWTDNQDQSYEAEINQFHGLISKTELAGKDKTSGTVIAVGRLLPCSHYEDLGPCKDDLEYLERFKRENNENSVSKNCINVSEIENHWEMSFDLSGGEVTGSYRWQIIDEYGGSYPYTQTLLWQGNFSGNYSGGKRGKFEGNLKGSVHLDISGDQETYTPDGTVNGTWTAEMKGDGKIQGSFEYVLSYPDGKRFQDSLDFRAAF